ncbi:probable protein S-acyltransferase 23 isoform X2 [Eurytemora carolleeae]|uniref:probable protein S-acyltransferase 23 isoform X2 n=1 Tax=Eurytemora carolleeae TaxID=1294199 RepID=UPI000C76C82D|nr:probable protein S-acyltransferase 23 isoform X2 [Eurytemora carolleeae]|eukprot:XP_023331098.1 probable protein S-acyltransferase 23 isoform X2 [Eurytemora affinis]
MAMAACPEEVDQIMRASTSKDGSWDNTDNYPGSGSEIWPDSDTLREKLWVDSLGGRDTQWSSWEDNSESSTVCDNIFEIMRSGNLGQVEYFFEKYGMEYSLDQRDEYGHSPPHWMALNGHATIARYLMERGGKIDLHSNNSQGPRPIHWASRNGHVAVVDLLLEAGVPVDATDHKGLTPLMMACMFGRSMIAAYLLGKGAAPHLTDMNGDSALHWAAYKGYPGLMQMLIYSGFDPQKPDNFGSSPLHLACISGNLSAVKLLCAKNSVDLEPRDRNRKTPLDLAAKHGHQDIMKFLESEKRRRTTFLPVFLDIWTVVFGQSGRTKGPLLFFLGSVLLWAYPMYFLRCVPVTWDLLPVTHYSFLTVNLIMWISLIFSNRRNPGFLPQNTDEYHNAIKQIAYYDEWKHHRGPDIMRLCHTCRSVRPLRAKHCRVCDRCVAQFDHHCPYISNCVGLRNRGWFLLFTLSVAINCSITIFFACFCISVEGWKLLYIIGLIEALIFCGLGWLLSGFTLLYAAMNLTSNEMFHYKRYNYLKNSRGKYHNPFSRGVFYNLAEFFLCVQPADQELINLRDL